MKKIRILKAKEIASELMKNPEAPVWCGAWNGYVDTYAAVDHVFKFSYEEVSNDFFGTPGRMDSRVLQEKSKEVFYIGSLFGKVKNPDIDFGNDDIDYPILEINGKDGDPNLVWKLNKFDSTDSKFWKKEGEGWRIEYDTSDQTIDVHNFREGLRFVGKVIGIETLRNVIKLCKINLEICT